MNTTERSSMIKAPLHQIFEFVRDPVHLLELCPNLISVETMQPLNMGGKDFRWEYRLIDVRFEGISRTTEMVWDQCLINRIEGGITGIVTWLLREEAGQSQITLIVEYNMPQPLLRRHTAAFIAHANELAVESILANLKAKLEGIKAGDIATEDIELP